MAHFGVTTGKLEEESAQLLTLKRQLEQECATMKSIATSYLSMWDGEAKQAFVNSANQNINLISAFTNNVQKFSDALKQSAASYETGENQAKRIASQKGQ